MCSMGKFGGPHKLCILRTLNLEVPINCVLLEHCIFFLFWGHSAGPNG